jgi:trimeric autotransporter adhesin
MKTLIRSNSRSPLRCGFFTLAIALCWIALSPPTKAQCPSNCSNDSNTSVGNNALPATIGFNNTAVGSAALNADTTGSFNVAIGGGALQSNTTGQQNMAIGAEALLNSNGNFNMGIGFRTLFTNTTGSRNSGVGAAALRNNTTASDNTAIGSTALRENTTGEFNTAVGSNALNANTTSSDNVAVGDSALAVYNGTNLGIDGFNTALGSIALSALTEGFQNTAVGRRALEFVTTGNNNVAVGWRTGDGITTGSGNTFIGTLAGSLAPAIGTYNNTILLGISGDANGNNPDGRAYIGSVRGVTTGDGDGIAVLIDSSGQLGTSNSSRRFKDGIETMDHKVSEAILKLKPVTFHYKDLDTKKAHDTPQYGLIAEDVAEVSPDLIFRDKDGLPLTVRYDAVNVMLLNEFLKEHKRVEEQQASIAELKSTVASQQKEMKVLTTQLKEQAAQIQKVSAQLEASKPAPKVVANP